MCPHTCRPEAVGHAIAKLRQSLGLTQKEVAASVSTHYSDDRAYRRGAWRAHADRDKVIAILNRGLSIGQTETINRVLGLAGYAALTEAEIRSLKPAAVTGPVSVPVVPQKVNAEFWLGLKGRKRLVAVTVFSVVLGGVIASTGPNGVMVMLTAMLYGSLYAVSVLLESVLGPESGKTVSASTGVFCLMLLTSVVALAVDGWLVDAGNIAALPVSLVVFVLSAGLQWLLVKSALPESAVVPSRFPSHTAQAAHLKNTLYFLLIVVLFWLPPVHCIAVLHREIRAGNATIAKEMLGRTVLIGHDVACLNSTWLWGLFLLLLLLAIPMGAWLTNNLNPHPKTNIYVNLLYLRAFLYFLLILACLIWFSSSIGSLPLQ